MDKIKTILLTAFALVVAMSVASCGDDDNPTVAPSATGTFEDTDGTLYHWVRVGSLDWMVENYRGGEAWYNQSYVANGFESHFDVDDEDAENALIAQQGNYLTWQQAKDCAPEGWRLPTDDDFKNLEAALGMKAGDIDKEGWRSGAGTLMMQQGEDTQLAFVLAGELGSFSTAFPDKYHVGDYGCYWTATQDTTKSNECAIIRAVVAGGNMVQRVACATDLRWMSVKYVRDDK